MTTITWTIGAIDYNIEAGVNVPTTVHWRCTGVDDAGNVGSAYGTRSVTQGETKTLTSWDNITEEAALLWLFTDMSVATMDLDEEGNDSKSEKEAIEDAVNAQIAEKANPTHGSGLPWSNSVTGSMEI